VAFKEAMENYSNVTFQAEMEALPNQLLRDGAWWQALRYAQGKPYRALYFGLSSIIGTWKFATLPLKFGWGVANYIDAFLRTVLSGVLDPRAYMMGGANPRLKSVFEAGVTDMREFIRFANRLFDNSDEAVSLFDAVLGTVWAQPARVVSKLFGLHDVPVDESIVTAARLAYELQLKGIRVNLSLDNNVLTALKQDVGAPPDLSVSFTNIGDPSRPGGYAFYNHFDRSVEIHIPEELQTAFNSERLASAVTTMVLHELRHSWQHNRLLTGGWFRRLVEKHLNDSIPYKIRPSEIDANRFAKANVGKYEGLVRVTPTSPLPADPSVIKAVRIEGRGARRQPREPVAPTGPIPEMVPDGRGGFVPLEKSLSQAPFSYEGDAILPRRHPTVKGKIVPGARLDRFDPITRSDIEAFGIDPNWFERSLIPLSSFHDKVWELIGNRPENYFRRVIYRDTYRKAINRGATPEMAWTEAWKKVEDTLFDYSKITVIEDNLRFFIPFVQYARKNSMFWFKQLADKPWFLTATAARLDEGRREENLDLPEAFKRYLGVGWASDVVSRIPGLSWMASFIEQAFYDPINFFSFKYLYRMFKMENPLLPVDRAGNKMLTGMVDALEDWGFLMNPVVRKPLELFGVLDLRAWQNAFPQTDLVDAFTQRFLRERFPNGFNPEHWLEDPLFQLIHDGESIKSFEKETFNSLVQREMAGQAARGEPISREKATKKVQDFIFVKTLIGYFANAYVRRITPEDIYYQQMFEDLGQHHIDFNDLTEEERRNYRLFKRRGWDQKRYDDYVESIPLIKQYYSMSYQEGKSFLTEHPELRAHVEELYGRRDNQKIGYVQKAMLQEKSDTIFKLQDLVERFDVHHSLHDIAQSVLVTREIKSYWAANDTDTKMRTEMLRARYYEELEDKQKTYHSIPNTDYEARQAFLDDNPDLVRWWQTIGTFSGDMKTIVNSSSAAIRERYFEYLRGSEPDFDGAVKFLQRFPWAFETSRKKEKYREIIRTGQYPGYTPYSRGSGGDYTGGHSQHAADYLAAKRWLDYYFDLPDGQRDDWLDGAGKGAAVVRAYFDKYSDRSDRPRTARGRDYLKAKKALDHYFALRKRNKNAAYNWLRGNSKQAQLARWYFDKYGTQSPKAKAYEAAKKWLDLYFSLSEDQRYDWLHSGKAGARIVLAYFKKYGKPGPVSQHQQDFVAVKAQINMFFSLIDVDKDAAYRYLDAHPELQSYFDKYGEEGGQSQHSIDFVAAREMINFYFSLRDVHGKDYARTWLNSAEPGAEMVRDYFKKYSKQNEMSRSFTGSRSWGGPTRSRSVGHRRFFTRSAGRLEAGDFDDFVTTTTDPQLALRLKFWQIYFDLPPNERNQFVADHGEEYGIFVYGFLGDQSEHDEEQLWMQQGFAWQNQSESAKVAQLAKPLLNFYNRLPKGDPARDLFLRANPELQMYFELFGKKPNTGNDKLDGLLELYFKLPRGSRQRSTMLFENAELQDWFDQNSSPQDAAMHTLLETYFSLPTSQRKAFAQQHPEISEYFDKRREEKSAENAVLEAFDRADPRLAPFFAASEIEIYRDAWIKKYQMLQSQAGEILLEQRRARAKQKPARRRELAVA
jgi:hypothetical protein